MKMYELSAYNAPTIEVMSVAAEHGFAVSGTGPGGEIEEFGW